MRVPGHSWEFNWWLDYDYDDMSDGVYYDTDDMEVDVDVENQYYNSKGTQKTNKTTSEIKHCRAPCRGRISGERT